MEAIRVRTFSRSDKDACLPVFDSNRPTFLSAAERPQFSAFLDHLPGPYLVLEDASGRVVACGGYAVEAGAAQDPVYADVRDELAAGRKRSHWMWFVFLIQPQVAAELKAQTTYEDAALWAVERFHPRYLVLQMDMFPRLEAGYVSQFCGLVKDFSGEEYRYPNDLGIYACSK